jgi:hypothetical protein
MLARTALIGIYCHAFRNEISAFAVPAAGSAFMLGKSSSAGGAEKLNCAVKGRVAHMVLLYHRRAALRRLMKTYGKRASSF